MSTATVWWLLAAAAVGLELVSGTFYLLMLALGLAAGALAAQIGLGLALQFGAAALFGGGAVLFWSRRLRRKAGGEGDGGDGGNGRGDSRDGSDNPDLNLDIGQTVQVEHWQRDGSAQVRHRGADWSAELADPSVHPTPGRYRIVAMRGSHLILQALPQ